MQHLNASLSRRRALALGGAVSGGLVAASTGASLAGPLPPGFAPQGRGNPPILRVADKGSQLPVKEIEAALQSPGEVSSSGVLTISVSRTDLMHVTRSGVKWLPSFEVNGAAKFQLLGSGKAIMNGDMSLLAKETNPFIGALLKNGLVFQALHQHFLDQSPQIWHIHFRGMGDPEQLAKGLFNALSQTTGTPFPQQASSGSSQMPTEQMGQILGGKAKVTTGGVVTFDIPRSDQVTLGGVPVAGDLNIGLNIAFEPLDDGRVVGAPDFNMLAAEVDPVMKAMLAKGWEIGCLYNQETDEHPQLYFSHQWKIGDPVELAREIRKGADNLKLKFTS